MKAKSQVTELRLLPAASVGDLKAATRKRIDRMKAQSPRDGITVERSRLSIDRTKLKAQLKTYRRLRAAVERNLAKQLQAEGLDAVLAAEDDLRKTLAGQIHEKRPLRKGL
jgi:CRISPR/Cas system CSM-associated protein Csm3 (group 7 of RAMP superfamily)